MDANTPATGQHRLDDCSDGELRFIIEAAQRMLATRENERRQQALVQIRALAKAHGLGLSVKQPARKRGRPPKSEA